MFWEEKAGASDVVWSERGSLWKGPRGAIATSGKLIASGDGDTLEERHVRVVGVW